MELFGSINGFKQNSWLHQTYIDSLLLIMLGLDHAENLHEKRPSGCDYWQASTAEAILVF